MTVDAHCHASPVWFEPVESLLFQMDRCGVSHAVLVQALGQYDNTYQQRCLSREGARFASVVAIDPEAPDAVESLRRLSGEGAAGVRLRPLARSPGEDPLALWRAAAAEGLAVSSVGTTAQFRDPVFLETLGAASDLPVVLEHLGGLARPDADPAHRDDILALARFPNVFLKAPGLGQMAPRGPRLPADGCPVRVEAAREMLLPALHAFGPARLMWGSDYPPVSSREGYGNALGWTRDLLAETLPPEGVAAVMGGVAARVFRLSA